MAYRNESGVSGEIQKSDALIEFKGSWDLES